MPHMSNLPWMQTYIFSAMTLFLMMHMNYLMLKNSKLMMYKETNKKNQAWKW